MLTLDTILHFLKSFPGCLFLKDAHGDYCYCSELCDQIYSTNKNGIIGKNDLEIQNDPMLGRQYYDEDQKLLREGGSIKCYSEFKTPDGSLYYEINKAAVQDNDGNIIGIIGTVVDATKEFELQKQIQRQFVTDVITGVYNNNYLKSWLKEETPVYPFTLIACDCNFLKHINDMFGHEYGDQLLRSTGELFWENLPENCVPVRVGGDEFLILCNATGEDEADRLVALLTEKAQKKFIKGSKLSIAYGAHTIREGEMTFEECRSIADSKMYAAKRIMKQEFFEQTGKDDPVYNEERFRNLISQMPVIIFFKDTECRYQYINSYNEKHLKNKNDTHNGIGLTDLELQKDEALGREYYEDDLRILATGKGSILLSELVIDGTQKYYQITKSAVRSEEGTIIGIAGIVTDITATKITFASDTVRK